MDEEELDEVDPDTDEVEAEGDGYLAYEDDEWDGADRSMLSQLLRAEGIAFAWEATTLVVHAVDEEAVDRLIEQVALSQVPPLDPDAPKIVYELDGWNEEQRGALAEALVAAGVAHGWEEEDNLVVADEDEETVDPIIDRLDLADGGDDGDDGDEAGDADEGDGLAAQDAMSELFVAADRLARDPDDGEGVLRMVDAAGVVESLDLPYGFVPGEWQTIVDRATALAALLEDADIADDEVIEAARALRDHLRRLV